MTFDYLLMADYTMLQKCLMRRLKGTDLSSGQPKVLLYLIDHDGSIQSDIASACYLEASSLSSILDGMEKKQLVRRERDPRSRRSYCVRLTEKGMNLARRVRSEFDQLEKEMFSGLDETNLQSMLQALSHIHEVLTVLSAGQKRDRETGSDEGRS